MPFNIGPIELLVVLLVLGLVVAALSLGIRRPMISVPGIRTGPSESASRWATWVIWLAILAPLPYTLSRVLWAVGIPVGFSSAGLRELDIPGWGSLTVLGLALLAEATAVFVHVVVLSRACTVPRWVPLVHGRRVRPRMAIAVLALPIAVLVYALAISASAPLGLLELPDTSPNQEGWGGAWLTIVVFSVWTPALIATTWIYRLRTRLS